MPLSKHRRKEKKGIRPARKELIASRPHCGLCGSSRELTKTACCGNWTCDDEGSYVPFSYARNSCSRNHRRYTLCAHHNAEDHEGNWKTCDQCRESFETEMYVWYGTNEYNFEKLPNPPSYEPTRCVKCGAIIRLAEDSHTRIPNKGYECERCYPLVS